MPFVLRRTLAALIAVVAAAAASGQAAPIVAEVNGIKVSIVLTAETAEITVSAAVTGWVAVGIDPTNRMKDADFKIGYVKNGQAFARDDYGNTIISHAPDDKNGGANDIVAFRGVEADGVTSFTFTIKRAPTDPRDAKLGPGRHLFLLGAARTDDFTTKHLRMGKVTIDLPQTATGP